MTGHQSPLIFYSSGKISRLPDLILIGFLLLVGVWIAIRASTLPQYDWNWSLLLKFLVIDKNGTKEPGLLAKGLGMTLRVGFWTILVSFVCGAPIGAFAARSKSFASFVIQLYINIIRNTPPLVFLFVIYFFAGQILPVTSINNFVHSLPQPVPDCVKYVFASPDQMDRMLSALIALGMYQGAYIAEIVRAGIESVPRGQWDAALALGFPHWRALVAVILPQAARLMIPPLTGQATTTIKDSALVAMISLPDLTFQSLEAMAVSQLTFEIWIVCALLYLLLGLACAFVGKKLEKRYASFEY